MTSPNLAGLIEALKPFAEHFYGEPEKAGEPFPIDDVNPVVFGLDSPLDGAITVGHFRAARLSYAAALRGVSDEQGAGWRSMESAPKDGTEIILFFPSYTTDPVGVYRYDANGPEGWESLTGWGNVEGEDSPTHWMPLPAAPDPAIPADTQSREGEKP